MSIHLRPARRLVAAMAVGLLAMLSLLVAPALPARAASGVQEMNVEAQLKADGALTVSETFTFDQAPGELVQRVAETRETLNKADYVYQVSDVMVTGEGGQPEVSTEDDGTYTVIKVKPNGAKKVTLTYSATGAVQKQDDGRTRFTWRLLQGLSEPVEKFHAVVTPPGNIEDLTCVSGAPASPRTCTMFQGGTHQSQFPTFDDGPLGAGHIVEVSLGFPSGVVAANEQIRERWSLDKAFSLKAMPLLAALGALLLGGAALWALHRRSGQDAAFSKPVQIADFVPVDEGRSEFRVKTDVRPGQVGTLLDERVDPVDVTASLLDLAVRGHLLIHELPKASANAPLDWEFERRQGADELHPYEEQLLAAVAPADRRVKVSEMGPVVADAVPGVQSALYDEMVSRGWYVQRPDRTRSTWAMVGWGALAVSLVLLAILIAFTSYGLLGLVAVGLALALVLVAQQMPARTEHGASILSGLMALRSQLETHPTDQMPVGREYAELSEVLPYAVVLGGQRRWLDAIVAADDDEADDPEDLDWYHAPEGWHLQELPTSIDAFVTTVTGRLFQRN